ncbi:uncharacterized protein B0H18DRAFT_1206927 [Fomitopsis serialis]|uniref:uncharacterized protein n=1 Tax=Fomitopsis serialis TaxID=139415 RepID=UPI002007789D|nr:uncharacterized protein B0H18DRAFT_1206927 [Neoantrodia serialis]KAH9936687.1 hypothetical protein B0H18DRAFT_1206927 [Neoantrodia serialis]
MAASNIGHNVDVSSLESQPRTHETIADKIAHHYRCIYDLRTQWNDLSPISALPPEVLAEIFLHVAGIRASNIHSRLPYIDEWIYVSHVCRRWRFVALGCPALWSRLTVKGPASCQWLPEFLARSNQVSLSMAISFETHSSFGFGTPLPEELISIALSSLRRMRTLKIDAAPGYSPEIMKLLEGPAPLLEDLYISETKPSGILDPLNQLLRCPETCRLRRLDLKCPVDWAGISLSGLTRLSVGSSYRVMKLDAFLAALAQMPRLEELATDGAFIPNYYGEAHTPSLPTPAHLPRIRTLRIWRETAAQCACILRSMETPALAQLSVNAIPRGSVASQIELFAASAAKRKSWGDSSP